MSQAALSNREQDRLLKETKAEALKKCDDVVKGRTISVTWACRGEHKVMQQCLKQYTSEEAMDKVRRDFLQKNRAK